MAKNNRLAQLGQTLERRARVLTARIPKRSGIPLPEDCAQMVLERLIAAYGIQELDSWTDQKLLGYGYQTLHRLIIDVSIKKSEWLDDASDSESDGDVSMRAVDFGPSPEQSLISGQKLTIIQRLLGRLSDEERRFVLLATDLGSAPLAQKELGWPPGSASNACHRCAKLMKQLLAWATLEQGARSAA